MSKRLEKFPEKKFELKEGIQDLHKTEYDRRVEINKIEEESGGFKPQQFKSSRSSRFGSSTKPTDAQAPSAQPSQSIKPVSAPAASQQEMQKSLMHSNVIIFFLRHSFIYESINIFSF
jgi:hypothetical protein